MQVGGLPAGVYRLARLASRIAAPPPTSEAAIRDDALRRWREARAAGLTALQAARAVGVSRASLYRWARRLEPRSRRPHRLRRPTTTPALREAVERLRQDQPMWGKAKLGPVLRALGFAVSDTTVGRVLARLIARGTVLSVPVLIRGCRLKRARPKRPHARRLPKDYAVRRPGDLVQLDTLSITLAPGRGVKQFTAGACTRAGAAGPG
jgi:putative transposase